MIRVLVVDDDYRVASLHADFVGRVDGFEVAARAHSAGHARAAIERDAPDLVLLDLYLPDASGLDLLRLVRSRPQGPDVIVISAARDVRSVRTAMQLGAVHYLVKPFTFEQLERKLETYRDLRRRFERLDEADQDEVDALYGVLHAPTDAPARKGRSSVTLARVRDAVRSSTGDVSAADVAAAVGISRPTAMRYLAYLAENGVLELSLRYGTTGRPEHRYRMARRAG